MGGMGAVYQAWDDELGVAVALKVVRPEITSDPTAARDLERRFKRELLLARQVTHKNVVRIHDLGEIDGVKYITMPYIQGNDLGSILSTQGKMPVPRAISIAKQVVDGLRAAHEAGVVHRDLKPANIMVDADDQAVIMDFGIARSVSGGGATVAGAVVGTLEYMAPEQAMAQPVDQRADIYAFGLILYDMVLGPRQSSRAESAVAELMSRVMKPMPPARSVDPAIPEPLERIIDKCTQPDPVSRYQTTVQLAQDLELLDGAGRLPAGTAGLVAPMTRPYPTGVAVSRSRGVPLKAVLAAAALLLIAAAGWLLRDQVFRTRDATGSSGSKPVSLAILPFRNASGNANLDWLGSSLADMIKTELGQTAGLRIVPSDRVSQILRDLRISSSTELDAPTLSRLAEFSNAEILVTGQYAQFGGALRFDASLQGPKRPTPVVVKAEASGESEIPKAVQTLARSFLQNLAVAPSAAAPGARSALPGPTSSSMQALKAYSEGMQFAKEGNHLEAVKRFKAATEADPDFALAFVRLAQGYANTGYANEAEQAARTAAELGEKLPPEQRNLVEAVRASVINDPKRAIEAYETLTKIAPDDTQVLFDLAVLYENTGALDKARDTFAQVLERDPKHSDALFAIGRVEVRRRNPQAALEFLNRYLSLAIQTDNQPAKGAALNAIGVAYKRLEKPQEALRYYKEALDVRRAVNDRRGIAVTLNEMGQIQRRLRQFEEAYASHNEALEIRRKIGDKRGQGDTLMDLGVLHEERGEYDKALERNKESLQIQLDIGNENYQGLCLFNIGKISLRLGRYDEALSSLERSLQIRERSKVPTLIADTLHSIGELLIKTGQYDRAMSGYLRALELRRSTNDRLGAAGESFGMGTIFEHQGRYRAAYDARSEAVKVFRESNDRLATSEMLSGYGSTLVLLGRSAEARPILDEALGIARELKDIRLIALALSTKGDSFLADNDPRSARPLFEEAVRTVSKQVEPELQLILQLKLSLTDVRDGRSRVAIPKLRSLLQQAEALRLRPLAAESALYLGEALLVSSDLAGARRQLESSLSLGEKLGLRPVVAQAHYLLGQTLRQSKDSAGAARHQDQARQIVDAMRKEAGTDDLLKRAELRRVLAAATPPS